MAKFKCGDVVTLKSGGPKMTVFAVNDDDRKYILCFFTEGKPPATWGIYEELEQIPEDVLMDADAVDMMREDGPQEFPESVLGIA